MKNKISVCSKCLNPKCSGKRFEVEGNYGKFIVCENEIKYINNKPIYHYVMGHGCEWNVEAKEVK